MEGRLRPAPNLGTAFTREAIQAARPDFVFAGWSYGFQETTGVTPDWIRTIGAVPYQLTEACRQAGSTKRGIMPPLEALFTDLEDLGTLFGVPDRAERLITEYRARIEKARSGAPSDEARKARVLLFDSASPTRSRRAARDAAGDHRERRRGERVRGPRRFVDHGVVGGRGATRPAGDHDRRTTAWGRRTRPKRRSHNCARSHCWSNTTAVRDGNFVVLPYAALVEGPPHARQRRDPGRVPALEGFLT